MELNSIVEGISMQAGLNSVRGEYRRIQCINHNLHETQNVFQLEEHMQKMLNINPSQLTLN